MSGYTFKTTKDAGELIDYVIDWSAELQATEPMDAILASEWRVEGRDASLAIVLDYAESARTYVYVAGGTKTNRYRLINRVSTVAGRTFERSILVEMIVK
jgi:hypothetical protein